MGWATFTYEIVATTNPTRLSFFASGRMTVLIGLSHVIANCVNVDNVIVRLKTPEADNLWRPTLHWVNNLHSWYQGQDVCEAMGKVAHCLRDA